MTNRKIGFNTRKASTAIRASHNRILASKRLNLEATPENCKVRASRDLSVTILARFLPRRDLGAERVAPLLDDFGHALGDFGDRWPDDLQIFGRPGDLGSQNFGPDGFSEMI